MNRNHEATAEDFKNWESKAKGMTNESLRYVIADCRAAAIANATMPSPNKENFYKDQGMTFFSELQKRRVNK